MNKIKLRKKIHNETKIGNLTGRVQSMIIKTLTNLKKKLINIVKTSTKIKYIYTYI